MPEPPSTTAGQCLPELRLRPNPYAAPLLAVSGMDGAGKTTLVGLLRETLEDLGQRVVLSQQPSARVRGWREFRAALDGTVPPPFDRRALAGLIAWDRLTLQLDEVLPALASGRAVICERYVLDLCVFGPYRGASPDWLAGWLEPLIRPNVALLADTPSDEIARRLAGRPASGKREESPKAIAELVGRYRAAAAHYGAVVIDCSRGHAAARSEVGVIARTAVEAAEQSGGSPAPPVAVLLGSTSDQTRLAESGLLELLDSLGLRYRFEVISSDREPERLREFCRTNRDGLRAVIAGAGGVPNLPVVVKSWLPDLPVVGVPLDDDPALALAALTTPRDRPVILVGWGVSGLRKAAYTIRDILHGPTH